MIYDLKYFTNLIFRIYYSQALLFYKDNFEEFKKTKGKLFLRSLVKITQININ